MASGGESVASVAGITLFTRDANNLVSHETEEGVVPTVYFTVGDGLEGSLGADNISGYLIQVSPSSANNVSLSDMRLDTGSSLRLMVDGIEYKDMSSSGKLTFSLPKIPDGASVQLLTPQFLNGELKVEISTLSQGSAGDVARSDAVELTVSILPEADGVKVTTLVEPL